MRWTRCCRSAAGWTLLQACERHWPHCTRPAPAMPMCRMHWQTCRRCREWRRAWAPLPTRCERWRCGWGGGTAAADVQCLIQQPAGACMAAKSCLATALSCRATTPKRNRAWKSCWRVLLTSTPPCCCCQRALHPRWPCCRRHRSGGGEEGSLAVSAVELQLLLLCHLSAHAAVACACQCAGLTGQPAGGCGGSRLTGIPG